MPCPFRSYYSLMRTNTLGFHSFPIFFVDTEVDDLGEFYFAFFHYDSHPPGLLIHMLKYFRMRFWYFKKCIFGSIAELELIKSFWRLFIFYSSVTMTPGDQKFELSKQISFRNWSQIWKGFSISITSPDGFV